MEGDIRLLQGRCDPNGDGRNQPKTVEPLIDSFNIHTVAAAGVVVNAVPTVKEVTLPDGVVTS